MGFTSSAEVVTYIGGIFEAAFEDEELAPRLKDTGVVLMFELADPDTVLVSVQGRGVDAAVAAFQRRRHGRPRLVIPHLEDPEAELRHPDAVVEGYVRHCAWHAPHLFATSRV